MLSLAASRKRYRPNDLEEVLRLVREAHLSPEKACERVALTTGFRVPPNTCKVSCLFGCGSPLVSVSLSVHSAYVSVVSRLPKSSRLIFGAQSTSQSLARC